MLLAIARSDTTAPMNVVLMLIGLTSLGLAATPVGAAQPTSASPDCRSEGDLSFVCGPKKPEDLAVLPGTDWLIASGMEEGAGLHLIDTRTKRWRRWIAARPVKSDPRFPDCDSPPDPERFSAHGLALRAAAKGTARLFVVGHGEREAVEVFDITMSGAQPHLSWRGCARAPGELAFNSVAAAPDGTLLATVLLLPGKTFADAFAGKSTGAVFEWRPGDHAFRQVEGTSLPADNGIEISPDGKTVYVAATPVQAVTAFARGKTWRKLWTVTTPDTSPDNLHWAPNGMLYAAGMAENEPACGGPVKVVNGRLSLFDCPRGYRVAAIDPNTAEVHIVARGAAVADYSGTATALPAGGNLWLSSLSGNRLAYRPWP